MSNEVHFWIFPESSKLLITPGNKTSGQQKRWRSLNWGSCWEAQQSDFNMNPAVAVVALSLLVTVTGQYPSHDHHDMAWVNGYRQSFNFQCPHGEVVVAIRSYYSEQEGSDRLWSFECQPTPEGLGEPSDCWWDDISRAGMEWWVLCLMSLIYLLFIIDQVRSAFFDCTAVS